MRALMRRLAGAVWLFALLAGCKAKQPDSASAAPERCAPSVAQYCKKWFECLPGGARQLYGTVDGCRQELEDHCRQFTPPADERPDYFARFIACNAALGSLSCEA